jgi:hypothetical protein
MKSYMIIVGALGIVGCSMTDRPNATRLSTKAESTPLSVFAAAATGTTPVTPTDTSQPLSIRVQPWDGCLVWPGGAGSDVSVRRRAFL